MKRGLSLFLLLLLPVLLLAEGEYVPHKPGPSLKARAAEALQKKAYEEAISLYTRWLEADPGDGTGWYDLACALALSGQKAKALDALESAVDAGFADRDHAAQDGDLASLREEPRFQAALARCAVPRESEPKEYRRHVIPMTSLGTYVAILPSDYATSGKSYPICLILHGNGSNELGHGALADSFGREGVIYVVPRAPYALVEGILETRRGAWTHRPAFDVPPEMGGEKFRLYVDWIFACAEDARKQYRVVGEKVFIFGHSLGAGMASSCAAQYPGKVAAYFAYAGNYAESTRKMFEEKFGFPASLKKHGVKVVIGHGSKDTDDNATENERATAEWMTKAGVDCRYLEFDNGHGVSKAVVEAVKAWLDAEVRPPAKAP